jgi:hypothetical protein
MKYIISLKHTHKEDAFFVLWRPDLCGYTYFQEAAGTYDNKTIKANDLNNRDSSLAVDERTILDLWEASPFDGIFAGGNILPNLPKTRKVLGILKSQLKRKYSGDCPSVKDYKNFKF